MARMLTLTLAACLPMAACGSATAAQVTCQAPHIEGLPATLQATGCFDAAANPATNLVRYSVNSPLFANGAGKDRWLLIAAGAEASFDPNGILQAPSNSAVFKEFSLEGVRLETRLLLQDTQGIWQGFSYAWNDAQTQANLLSTGETTTVNGQSWTYPSREDCQTCHNTTAGGLLGVRVPELLRTTEAPHGSTAQLQDLVDAHVIAGPAPTAAGWPDPQGDAPLAERARSYLAANCSFCHRPNGASGTQTNFLYDTALAQMGACNVAPQFGAFGLAGAQIIAPGDPNASILSYRMHSIVAGARMPPLGRSMVDSSGVALIDAWISSMKDCSAGSN